MDEEGKSAPGAGLGKQVLHVRTCIHVLKEIETTENKMNFIKQNRTTGDAFEHLPHYSALKDYDPSNWVCFGTLTHKHETSATVQLSRFKTLMDTIGSLNHSFGKRLHWVVRVEGGHESKCEEMKRTHLHFILARHKVTNGHKHQFTPDEACNFLEKVWEYGRVNVTPYNPSKDGLEYLLKCPHGPQSKEWNDMVELSPSLITLLTEKKLMDSYKGRDPLALTIFAALKKSGTPVYFGDEVPHWKAA